jgi:peptide/nickel transport system permease protein
LFVSWWFATFPGVALMITILGVNMMGDWLHDFLLI